MINENIVREIIRNTRFKFLIGRGAYFGSEAERKVYDTLFEAGLEWLYSYVLGKPKPKVVYCNNLHFLKKAKNKMDIHLHHTVVADALRDAIMLRPDEYLAFKKDNNFDKLIETEFNTPFLCMEGIRFDLFDTISVMLYQWEKSSFNLAGFLREVMVYTVYKSIHHYDAYSKNIDENFVIDEESLLHARNLCNAEVFHMFFGEDVVYALRYPYYQSSWRTKMTTLTNGSGGESSFKTSRPRFYWPYGPKIYASDTRLLPNWIFDEYMQEGYFRKIMDINDFDIRDDIVAMIRKDKGDSALFDMIHSDIGDECLAAYYYLWLTDSKAKRDDVFLNAIVGLLAKGEGDRKLVDFIEAGFGKEEIVEYYMRYFKIEKVWELFA